MGLQLQRAGSGMMQPAQSEAQLLSHGTKLDTAVHLSTAN